MAGPDLHVDMAELGRELKLVDKKFAASIKRELRKAVSEAGEEITRAVKHESSWSKGSAHKNQPGRSSIPAAATLGLSFTAKGVSVIVKVNAKKAPHARGLEFGTKGAGGGTLRHPVFLKSGSKPVWATQKTRPFFFSAVKAMTPVTEAKIQAAIDKIAIDAGFKGR